MRRLAEVKGLSEQKIQKFKDIIKANELVQMGFQTAATRLGAMNEMIKISTGKIFVHICSETVVTNNQIF